MILTGAFGGGLAGLVLASVLTNQLWLAIDTAFLAIVIALVVRHFLFRTHGQLLLPPGLGLWLVAISSLIGGLAGHELAVDLREPPPSPLIGAISGLLASVLISSFVMTISSIQKNDHG
jgi:hypothetical protein